MTEKEGKQFAVILSINPATPERLQTLVPELMKVLQHVSTEPPEPLFRSIGADHFGYLVRSKMKPAQIAAILQTPAAGSMMVSAREIANPFLTDRDGLIILEIGSEAHSPRGFTRAHTWLQRH